VLTGSIPPTGLPLPRQNTRFGTCVLLKNKHKHLTLGFSSPHKFRSCNLRGPQYASSTSLLVFMSAIGVVLI